MIYQKIQSTKNLTLFNTIYVQSLPRSVTLLAPETQAKQIVKLALDIGLEQAANEFDIEYIVTPAMSPDSLIVPANDLKGKLIKSLKYAQARDILGPLYSAEQSGWYIFEVVEKQTQDYRSLDEVREEIIEELCKEHRIAQNRKLVQQWIADNSFPATYEMVKLDNINIDSLWEGKPITNIYYQAIKAYLEKAPLPQITQKDIIIVPKVISYRPGKTKPNPERIKTIYAQNLPDGWFEDWLDKQVKKARVVIYTKP
jgi:hypothetical protein